jgi:glycosyltransferase involved in cell wall biosynthesis
MQPLISVIINCHNGEKYLQKSINSLLLQTYKKWELIFWDNNSKDRSKEIVLGFRDKRIKYFKAKKFSKLYHARNLAIKKAKGEYISFLDTDDWWAPNFLKNHYKKIEITKSNIVYSNYYIYNEKKKFFKLRSNKNMPNGLITQKLLDDYNIGILAVLIKKEVFKKNKFNSSYNIIGDFDFFINLSKTLNFHSIQSSSAYYRIHDNNFSNIKISMYIEELTKWIKINKFSLLKNKFNLNSVKFFLFKMKIKFFLKKLNLFKGP